MPNRVPQGWRLGSLGEIADARLDLWQPAPGDGRPYVALEHIAQGSPKLVGHAKSGDATSTKAVFRKGDLLFGKLRPNLRKAVLAPFDGVCSTDILVIRARRDSDPRYLECLAHYRPVQEHAVRTASGTKMPRTSWSLLKSCAVPIPPLAEQRKIAAILSSLDETIERTEAVIAQLDVVKKAMLEELLTRGIPGRHSRFKQTEIGEVPETWRVVPIADLASSVASGWSPECEEVRPRVGEWGVLKTTSITWEGGWDPLHAKRLPAHLAERPEHCVALGDILVTRAGPVERVGVVAVVDSEAPRLMISDKIIRLRLRSGLADPAFVALALSAANAQSHFHQRKTGLASSQVNISQAILCSCPVALPGLEEQALIARAFREHRTRCRAEARLLDQLATLKSALSAALLSGDLSVEEASN